MSIKIKDLNDFSKRVMISGFSQRSFAEHINVSNAMINQIFNEKRNPSAKIAKKITDGLGVSFDDIFFIENDNKSYQTA